MAVSCEGALILEQISVLNLMASNAEREIRVLEHEISERKDLLVKLDKKVTVLTNCHMAIGNRPDLQIMEFRNESYDTLKGH